MAVRANSYFNNPYLAQAAESLAGLFAPPSGTDAAGWAAANAKNAEASRLAQLFSYAQNPNVDQAAFDRGNIAVGNYAPSQSYYSVDQGNLTAQRGQDLSLAGTKYTADQGYNASTQNNVRDNTTVQRGQDITAGVDQRGQDITAMTSRQNNLRTTQGSLIGQIFGPLNPGQVRPALPGDVSGVLGLPGIDAAQGLPKPMTSDELTASILGGLPQPEQRAFALRDVPVEQTVAPTGPQFTFRPDAVGQKPSIVAKPENQTELARLLAEKAALAPDDVDGRLAYDARIEALGRGQQQGQYDKTSDELLAKQNAEIAQNAAGAVADEATLNTLLTAIDDPNATQGALATTDLAMRKMLGYFGINAGSTTSAEMINALGSQLALRLRDPSNGAGMPGSLSDSDRQFLLSMSVALGNSPDANRMLAKYYLRIQQKNIALEKMRQSYVAKNGRIDEGFRTAALKLQQDFYAGKPVDIGALVPGSQAANGVTSSPLTPMQPLPPSPTQTPAPAAFNGGGYFGGSGPTAPPAPPAPPGPPGPAQQPVSVATPDEAMRLPPGTPILLPDGTVGRVPGG